MGKMKKRRLTVYPRGASLGQFGTVAGRTRLKARAAGAATMPSMAKTTEKSEVFEEDPAITCSFQVSPTL